MDQELLVNDRLGAGQRLIQQLLDDNVEVSAAFWAQRAERGRWELFLVLPKVDLYGPKIGYQIINQFLDAHPEIQIENQIGPLDFVVLGERDSTGEAAVKAIQPRPATARFAVTSQLPYPGMTVVGGSSFGGLEVDGPVYIYPLPRKSVVTPAS